MYRPRDAEHTGLHQVIALHLEAFLDAVAEAGDGVGLPQFMEREFPEFLACGVFVIAILHDPVVIRKILAHLGPAPPTPGAAAP